MRLKCITSHTLAYSDIYSALITAISFSSFSVFPSDCRMAGAADAEIRVSRIATAELSKVPSFQPGIGQNIVFRASTDVKIAPLNYTNKIQTNKNISGSFSFILPYSSNRK